MDSAIETLRVEFEKACAELSFIEAKVESEFTRKFELERHAPLNPYKALTRLKKLKQTLQALKAENDQIMTAKQEFIRDTDAQLAANNELLLRLQMQAGIQPDLEVQNRLEYYNSISEAWREDMINYQGTKY
ncbi:8492_t:CDS:2 [Ambispora gerdemannii]|uniref:Protein FAM33A n=1 Tax=Ambispora gerdemannii TaxID=144530 RepID=A0A9N9FYL8_9GLOM|nr:8492_t:CDS:2 [Ambispora gerdemannii]